MTHFSYSRPCASPSSNSSSPQTSHLCPFLDSAARLSIDTTTRPSSPDRPLLHETFRAFPFTYLITMSDDKKSDDYGMSSAKGSRAPSPVTRSSKGSSVSVTENPVVAILSYCGSSILMTVTNKYVLSGRDFNLNFFLLCVQSVVCVVAISVCKASGVITYRDFNSDEAKKCTWRHLYGKGS